jgi:DNA-binding XRE family transcriptional regulator
LYKIKELRESMNMTQEELAEKSGVSRATICALESGAVRTTTTKTLIKIAQALSTTIDQIFFADSV